VAEKLRRVQWLKQEARRLGFPIAGITSPDPPSHVQVYQEWLDAGRHGEMHYLASERARECRQNPKTLFPNCQSILVLIAPYVPTQEMESHSLSQPRVSSYAVGEDYHEVLQGRVEGLLQSLSQFVDESFDYKIYTDTAPILEKELAQRAGLGWIGKNTCLIHPKIGSYVFLVEAFLDMDLPFDDPFSSDHCGSCTRCLDACPTGCILPNRTLDATRCLSYLTIELKADIPLELRSYLGNWAFGCDICQQVCPWNIRFAQRPDDPVFQPREEISHPDLSEWLQIDPVDFEQLTHRSPLRRVKRTGFLRNLAVVAGNSRNRRLVTPLARILQLEDHALPKIHAAWALGEIGGSEAIHALRLALESEKDDRVQMEIHSALLDK
jgi:epoxyqueuosine reductase